MKYVGNIELQIRYMNGLLDVVLLLGKGQAGKLEFVPTVLDLESFCHDILAHIQVADHSGHRFVFDVDGEFDQVVMDEKLLRHILINLLSNAVKYSPAASTVRLEVTRQGNYGIFQVSDA